MSLPLCPHGARGLMTCPECEEAAFKPKPTRKRRCRICGGDHWEDWHALGAYAKTVEEERDQYKRERDEANEACREKQSIIERMLESERQAVALLREAREHVPTGVRTFDINYENSTITEVIDVPLADRIDAFTAGQPAPSKPVVDDAMVEQAAAAAWNVAANRKWDEIPEEWKPFYRAAMRAGLERARKGEG